MKTSTKDQIKGKFHEIKGTVKKAAGRATKNFRLQTEGENERVAGKLQKRIGDLKKFFEKQK